MPNRYDSIVFNRTLAGLTDPPTFGEAASAANATYGPPNNAVWSHQCYTALSESDNKVCGAKGLGTNSNHDILLLFNFTIPDISTNITSIRFVMEANATSSGAAEAVALIQRNYTQDVYSKWIADFKTEATNTITYSQQSDINNILEDGIIQLGASGINMDTNEGIGVDFVQVVVNVTNYTIVNSEPIFNEGYPQINSTTGINETTEDLFAIFSAADAENSTIKFNVTWIRNNIV